MAHAAGTQDSRPTSSPGRFATTQWTQVLRAASADPEQAQEALAHFCGDYWPPLYGFVRRRGYSREDAEDIVQAFFERIIRNDALAGIEREGGRFRSFLLAGVTRLLATEWQKGQAQKRGAGTVLLPLDDPNLELRLAQASERDVAPETVFDREWALAVLDRAVRALRLDYETEGKERLFDALRHALIVETGQSYSVLALELGSTEGAVKTAVHRLRRRYGERIRSEIARTVSNPEEIADELRYLMRVVAE